MVLALRKDPNRCSLVDDFHPYRSLAIHRLEAGSSQLPEKQALEQSFLLRRAVADEMLRFVDSARPRLCQICGEGYVRMVERIIPALLMFSKRGNA